MQRAGSIILFTLLRLGLFLVPLLLLNWLLGPTWLWFSAIVSALIGIALSLLLLNPLRERYSEAVYDALHKETPEADKAPSDEDIEDAALKQE